MKPVQEWTEADLQALVRDGVPESLGLEYKSSAALSKDDKHRSELCKDVSAMANSAGGRVIYGIREENHAPVTVDGGLQPGGVSREWIEQILGNVHPRIQGLRIHPVPLAAGGIAYVLDVPQAATFAPHQAADGKYYKRFNFTSSPMEDHEVRDAFRRAQYGLPDVWFEWETMEMPGGLVEGVTFSAHITNLRDTPILYCSVRLIFEEQLLRGTNLTRGFDHRTEVARIGADQYRDLVIVDRDILTPGHMPIWRGRTCTLFRETLRIPPDGPHFFRMEVSWPGGSEEKQFHKTIKDGGVNFEDDETASIFRRPSRSGLNFG
ncbi:helix-turn-helix domain-containing protein [Sphingomonas sp. Leaf226]|uniref:AlbA family DNA-binding domain-containing protein n=1 Tax=Sphingomonas sp. Leaf226 TaxID=1735691 RepID=UPI0006FB9FFA|nr:ATP-binding protein [Sphingomonas sp. Leaf226]KQM90136.1 hypothetical protein ASE77_16110 [Sphingomonas sp. Leaf226]